MGRNGSGKSNFFAAIRFVLHDAYTKLGQEERQALLHEGGAIHMSAYVEIVFDNAEGRFPTGRDTTTIRRTVGLKKDEYSLDGKATGKTDIMNLLQAAGFSKSNPYYIVPQGRVTALTNAKDGERLALLKEVAGTRTYEEHRQESLRILEETRGKREKIRELLAFIEERMRELEEERIELKEYQEKERERRTLEYILRQRELQETNRDLEVLEAEHTETVGGQDGQSLAAFDDLVVQISDFEAQLLELRDRASEVEAELHQEEEQLAHCQQEKINLRLTVEDLTRRYATEEAEERSIRSSLEKINADIIFKEDMLATLIPQQRSTQAALQLVQEKQSAYEKRKTLLMAKQGRSIQFRSATERDRWIRKELEMITNNETSYNRQLASIEDELATARVKAHDLEQTVSRLSAAEANAQGDLGRLDGELAQVRRQRDQLTEQRKELWRAEAKLESSMSSLREEAARSERSLATVAEKGVMNALTAARRLAASLGLTGVHGALYELFSVDEVYRTATEIIAGPSLFHLVVDNEQTASRLMEALARERSGRLTFMPLNRLRPPPTTGVSLPEDRNEALPLLAQIRYDPRYEAAMRQVFGKAIICRDLAKGAALAREMGLTAITLKGDRADRKGALSGGHCEQGAGTSRLALAARFQTVMSRLGEHERLLAEIKVKLREVEPQIIRLLGEMESLECRRAELQRTSSSELELSKREMASLVELVTLKERQRLNITSSLAAMQAEMSSLQAEMGTPLTSSLTADEQAELREATKGSESYHGEMLALTEKVSALSREISSLENELDANLRRHRHELLVRLGGLAPATMAAALERAQADLVSTEGEIDRLEQTVTRLTGEVRSLSAKLQNVQSALDQARTAHDGAMRSQSAQHASMERLLTRRMALVERRETLQRRIRELAIVTDSLYETLSGESGSRLLKRLHNVNEELRTRYAHVNKKAHEQHAGFTKQGETLRERQAELESSAQAIDEFIRVLDRRKDEAIERTFQQVATGFAQVFEKLVPAGRGCLLMIRASDGDGDGTSINNYAGGDGGLNGTDSPVMAPSGLDFTGVGIRVSFNSKEDEGLLMSQLSGGQKSLVALALILAIQRCDPAPFYLFDEIDANLDAAYRTAVARLIGEMKTDAQFITTTFRPELLEDADLFWGVSFGGRVSRVEPITREQALQFVESDPK